MSATDAVSIDVLLRHLPLIYVEWIGMSRAVFYAEAFSDSTLA